MRFMDFIYIYIAAKMNAVALHILIFVINISRKPLRLKKKKKARYPTLCRRVEYLPIYVKCIQ